MASFFRRLIPARVANTGSQQRDHHANERTFLSWTRAGLGFAAMALALDRLEAVDRLIHKQLGLAGKPLEEPLVPMKREQPVNDNSAASQLAMLKNGLTASRICQSLGAWCLGYGFFRYWSMRRYLLVGKFVPAFWGPVFMTVGSFGALMTLGTQVKLKLPAEE
ncbi:uncharacterized protein N7469_010037 [Penicillium citrinum]|uniref:DUF202 domain-containing protein n=1 Tax=Penicillium citrinum TaxID=5077 RepID=A0A9W9TH02_PENCI|nr:uncharacterized protein N7469_010037 [Penicillium citrinum]KAJ5221150.1 hypothetical protein N7469_010037 [Penicillium citrinum]